MKTIISLLLVCLLNAGCNNPGGPTEKAASASSPTAKSVTAVDIQPTRRVLLVSFDGLRADAVDATDTPTLDRLIQAGSYHPTARAQLPPATVPNHVSMVTGLGVVRHGILLSVSLPGRVQATTIFDVAKQAGLSVGFFTTKSKLGYLCEESSVDVWKIVGDVDAIADEAVKAVAENDLRLVFLHFGEPDGAGHAHGWMSEPYLAQVTRDDAALARVLDAYEAKGEAEELLVIVTSDHGGHDKTHWMDTAEDRNVPFILSGPGIAVGRRLTRPLTPMDAAATALDYLGLSLESVQDGAPVEEASVDFEPPVETTPVALFGMPCGPFPFLFAVPTMACMFLWGRRGRRR